MMHGRKNIKLRSLNFHGYEESQKDFYT